MTTRSTKKTAVDAHGHGSTLIVASGFPRGWAVQAACERVLRAMVKQGVLRPGERIILSVSAVGAVEMARMNLKYRRRRAPTDVLSFEQKGLRAPRGMRLLGDLVLCLPVVSEQARECGHGVRAELAILITHGILHLLGYDHERSAREAARMNRLEQRVLGRAARGQKSGRAGLITRAHVKAKPCRKS